MAHSRVGLSTHVCGPWMMRSGVVALDDSTPAPPSFTDAVLTAGSTPIRAVHVEELRQAVVTLEGG